MLDETRKSLAVYRCGKATECLESAEMALKNGSLPTAVNRLYYAIFNSMRAVLSLELFDSNKHSGVISAFRQRYIKTGILPVELSDIIEQAYVTRNKSDYDDFYIISKEDVPKQIENVAVFLATVKEYIESNQNE
jgi:uncharacterized protein (UPF0332 family)